MNDFDKEIDLLEAAYKKLHTVEALEEDFVASASIIDTNDIDTDSLYDASDEDFFTYDENGDLSIESFLTNTITKFKMLADPLNISNGSYLTDALCGELICEMLTGAKNLRLVVLTNDLEDAKIVTNSISVCIQPYLDDYLEFAFPSGIDLTDNEAEIYGLVIDTNLTSIDFRFNNNTVTFLSATDPHIMKNQIANAFLSLSDVTVHDEILNDVQIYFENKKFTFNDQAIEALALFDSLGVMN